MPRINVFRSLGLFAANGFLSEAECAQYEHSIRCSTLEAAAVRREGIEERIEPSRRKVAVAGVDRALTTHLQERLMRLKQPLENHFGFALTGCETPQFLSYKQGDFYVPHSDSTDDSDAPAYVKQRSVSVVIFLSTPSDEFPSATYGGGALTFYGLIKEKDFTLCGLPLEPEAGLLVAFPSHIIHEVRPVTHGERHTIVSWFYSIRNTA